MPKRAVGVLALTIIVAFLAIFGSSPNETSANHILFNRTIANLNSTLCMDVNGGSMNWGAAIIQFNCHGGGNETWDIIPFVGSTTWHYIKNKKSGLCLDVPNGEDDPLLQLQQWPCNYTNAQKFQFPPAGQPGPIKTWNGLCVEILYARTDPFAPVIQYPCWNPLSTNQYWLDQAHTVVFAKIYEPTGDNPNQAQLNCGWHYNCADGTWPDANANGTDWQFPNQVKTDTYFRTYLSNSGSSGYAGWVRINDYNQVCNSTIAEIFDRWGVLVGQVWFAHTDPPPGYSLPYNLNLWTNAYTAARSGNYSAPDPMGCPTSGAHVHAEYWNNSGWGSQPGVYHNPAIPTEQNCHGCNSKANIWTRYTDSFSFRR